jgi:hypothetical protein
MRPLASEEKIATIMAYTHNLFIRGQVIVNEQVRVSIWLRTQAAPLYIHIYNPNVLLFGGTPPKPLNYSEFYLPTEDVIAFHLAPPEQDPLDYDQSELNRVMKPVDIQFGAFTVSTKLRISAQTELTTYLDVSQSAWMSAYDAAISSPYLPQLKVSVPMMLVNPRHVSFALSSQ